jgi:hypothetical protein
LLSGTAGRNDFSIHFTNHDGLNNIQAMLDAFVTKAQDAGRSFGIDFRPTNQDLIRLNLLDAIDY